MRVLVNAAAATGGGLSSYAAGLVGAWAASGQDEVSIVCTSQWWERQNLPGARPVFRRPGPGGRLFEEYAGVPRAAARAKADVVVGLLPIAPLLRLRPPLVVVAHDLRHEIRPWEFSRSSLLARRLEYARAYRRADRIIAISQRTHEDLVRSRPRLAAKTAVVHSGVDHQWLRSAPVHDGPRRDVIAFGHHSNKRPELAIDAFGRILRAATEDLRLHVVGVPDQDRRRLRDVGDRAGVPRERLEVVGHVPAEDFRTLLAGARLMLFASTFEGFGLPVLEAFACGVPVAAAPDPAIVEIAGGFAAIAAVDTADGLARAARLALDQQQDSGWQDAAVGWADAFTWARTVKGVRAECERIVVGADVSR